MMLTGALLLVSLGVIMGHGRESSRSRPFFGLDVPGADVATVDRLAEQLGCAPGVMNRFVKLDSDFTTEDLHGLAAGGRTPMVSLEPWSWRMRPAQGAAPGYSLRTVADGSHDAELAGIARVLATYDGKVLLRFAHEMNADWYPWGVVTNDNTPADYVQAWRHVHAVVSAVAPRVQWVWSPVAAWWPDPLPLRSVYPGDAYVDFVAASGYGHDGTAQDTFGAWHREVRTFTERPALLSETGADGPGKDRWIASLVPFLDDHPDVAGFVWFNTSPETTGATGDYRLDDSPAHLDAMRSTLDQLDVPCDHSASTTSGGHS
jgi:hypothetical protein